MASREGGVTVEVGAETGSGGHHQSPVAAYVAACMAP